MSHDAASRAAQGIADVLAGTLDHCNIALSRNEVEEAKQLLAEACEQLRRLRRDLREESGNAETWPDDTAR